MAVERPEGFLLIAITNRDTPLPPRERAEAICRLLEGNIYDRVHLRLNSQDECLELLSLIPSALHGRISVHNSTAGIVKLFPLAGVHLTGNSPLPPVGFDATKASLSISCHSAADVDGLTHEFSYAFLSPICDSISKPGYHAAFRPEELRRILRNSPGKRLVALGGMTLDKIPTIAAAGFAGMALLGAAKI